jgi:hypothetical protein
MKNRIFKDSPFFDEAVQMPVDKDVLAFRMRQRNDFACSCSGTEIIHEANSESLNLFAGPQTRLRWLILGLMINRVRAEAAQQIRPMIACRAPRSMGSIANQAA